MNFYNRNFDGYDNQMRIKNGLMLMSKNGIYKLGKLKNISYLEVDCCDKSDDAPTLWSI